MSISPVFSTNLATEIQISEHLHACDQGFVPHLSERVNIVEYTVKIAQHAVRYEAWAAGVLVGLVAAYLDENLHKTGFITNVSILSEYQGLGIASKLINICVDNAYDRGLSRIELEVDVRNHPAIGLYEKMGFSIQSTVNQIITMGAALDKLKLAEKQRNYNSEFKDSIDRKYSYSFDFDVMHSYMIRSFKPFFMQGNLLELGSFKGDFTERFIEHFDDITCVEASNAAIKEAKLKLGERVTYVNALLETVVLPKRYNNIVMTHVLEHLDDATLVLERVNNEWLAEGGRLFLACPNANAPSRQIAVKMGLISHNSAVTPAEAAHGHRCTYSLDTMERDAIAAGLRVVHRSGIFFKALANFQWDRLLQTDIISPEFLDGCYQIGQQYPDLCASIFLLCESGDSA